MLAPSTSCPEHQLQISARDENICLWGDWEARRRVSRGEESPHPGAEGECRSRRILEIQVPLAEGGARVFHVSHALPHPPPTFVLFPLPLGSGWGRCSFLRCDSREGWAHDPVPERAYWARRPTGAEMGTLLASRARKSLPRARWSRFSRDQKGRQGLPQLQIYF